MRSSASSTIAGLTMLVLGGLLAIGSAHAQEKLWEKVQSEGELRKLALRSPPLTPFAILRRASGAGSRSTC